MDNYLVYKVTYNDGSSRLIASESIYAVMVKLLDEHNMSGAYGNNCPVVISIKEHSYIEVAN